MSFTAEYLAQLDAFAARGPLPRVHALHLPPARAKLDAHDNKGEFCALELEDGSLGLSYVLLDDTLARLRAGGDSLGLVGADALTVARRYASADSFARTIGFAAANALTRCLFDRAGFHPDDSADSIGQMNPQPGEQIGMIGLFRPLLARILQSGAHLTVVELNAELAGDTEGYRVTLDASELAGCTQVVSTSTLLLNDTLDRMLGHCRNARWFAMVGPGAGCLPDALFARGVTLLGGSWVSERQGFIDALKRGEARSAFAGKFALTADNYPGFEVLLDRACLMGK
jgi:uncharacterized protein (DUF4213/DUF364 family)